MFNGVPSEQFHQFIDSTRPPSLPFTLFDPFPSSSSSSSPSPFFPSSLHHLHLQTTNDLYWSADEILALLRIRSSMDNWLPPHSTWEHVSRKLAELGFKRSADKCKLKFEEESSRYFNNNNNYNKNYRYLTDLEELYNENPQIGADKGNEKPCEEEEAQVEEEEDKSGHNLEPDTRIETETNNKDHNPADAEKSITKKRRKHQKFEMLKGFCENIVNKLLSQQEEMHNKLLEDMAKRDEDKVAREEAWKKKEMDSIDKELEIRAHEQALAGDRQVIIIECLNKFNSDSSPPLSQVLNGLNYNNPQNPNAVVSPNSDTTITTAPNKSSQSLPTNISELPTLKNPTFVKHKSSPLQPNSMKNNKEELGKRWPRDEVLALINLRASFYNGEDKEGVALSSSSAKAPLWERISVGMLELGYKRSAKRCKEKWENINKYFRKTKYANKKRSLDSRTCPYFHQLTSLYSQGILVSPSEVPENRSGSPENHSATLKTQLDRCDDSSPMDFGF